MQSILNLSYVQCEWFILVHWRSSNEFWSYYHHSTVISVRFHEPTLSMSCALGDMSSPHGVRGTPCHRCLQEWRRYKWQKWMPCDVISLTKVHSFTVEPGVRAAEFFPVGDWIISVDALFFTTLMSLVLYAALSFAYIMLTYSSGQSDSWQKSWNLDCVDSPLQRGFYRLGG